MGLYYVCVSQFVQADITKYHELGVLHATEITSHSSGGRKSKIKAPADLVSGESQLPGSQTCFLPAVSSHGGHK